MTNIKRILVPTDFSETARTAYEYAISLAEQFKASVDVVHIYRPITVDIASLYPSKETRLVWEKQLQDTLISFRFSVTNLLSAPLLRL